MNSSGLGDLLRKHPQLFKIVFRTLEDHNINPLLVKDKLRLSDEINSVETEAKRNSWEWFMQFVDESFLLIGKYSRCILFSKITLKLIIIS